MTNAFEDAVAYLGPEAKARLEIDRRLKAAGWHVQKYKEMNLYAGVGIAVREYPLLPGHGVCDYMLFVNQKALGILEAKKGGDTLSGVERQSKRYTEGLPTAVPAVAVPLPFAYQSTGVETVFTNGLEPDARSRPVFWFHRPESLAGMVPQLGEHADASVLRSRLVSMPALEKDGLWDVQYRAITALEKSLAKNHPRALIQMATGAGKTFTAVNEAYRLAKFASAKRVLFLVDRANLGRQALKEFQQFVTPDDGRKFTELYNAQRLNSNAIDPAATVVISTIQRLYSILRGEAEMDEQVDEQSGEEIEPQRPVEVSYNPNVPIEMFDVIVLDECHRSIYGVWRQVVEYFDAFLVGLSATPGRQAFGFFRQNMVMEYTHEEAVADGVNVDFDVYEIKTKITEEGSVVEADLVTKFRDRQTRAIRYEKLDDDVSYDADALDRRVVSEDQIRTVLRAWRTALPTMFPGRTEVPKTLIFAKDDSHAEDIVRIAREEFGKGNDFAAKITYRAGTKAEELLTEFRTTYPMRIAVTVDMIATGTDVKPIECVFFMRAVRSRSFFEQMKGRGVRVIRPDDLKLVTPDADAKTRFVLVDAVGVTEQALSDTFPLERRNGVSLEKLLTQIATGVRDADSISSLASRLVRLDRQITKADRVQLEQVARGKSLVELAAGLLNAVDPDSVLSVARTAAGEMEPTPVLIEEARRRLMDDAVKPFASNPELRNKLVDVRASYEQLWDETSKDVVLSAGYSVTATDRAKATIDSFRAYIEEHKDQIEALQILYSRPYAHRLTLKEIKELAADIARPPRSWTPDRLWHAYEALDASKVRGSGGQLLTDLVSLVRFALEQDNELVPFQQTVSERFRNWLETQAQAGRVFDEEQLQWLDRIRDHIASSLAIGADDFDFAPFVQHGGLGRAVALFGADLQPLLADLSSALAA